MVTAHLLPGAAFTELAEGGGGSATIRFLHEVQRSKHTMLLCAIAAEAADTDPAPTAFRNAYALLARCQATDPGSAAWLLGLPHLGGWAHDCLIHFEQGSAADFGHFACLAAAAAVRSGIAFELDVPVRDGRVRLPGLGSVHAIDDCSWVRLRCDGHIVTVGDHFAAPWQLLVPDDGSGAALSHWSGTPVVHPAAGGLSWRLLLETDDPYLDRYTLPISARLRPDELWRWRQYLQSAWELLERHHRWAAQSIADGITAIVPLTPYAETDLVSATTPAAFGAIAMSWPPDAVTLAETLVHEFQHVKLGALMDMVPLVEPGGEKVYAPWRQDPRPVGGLLQGVYAHLGIVRFWRARQYAETDPDAALRARVLYARWRSAIDLASETLIRSGCLTSAGVRLVEILRARGQDLAADPVPPDVEAIADQAALDHWLTWQMQHVATDPIAVAALATAYRHGEPLPRQALPGVRLGEEVRKVDSTVRSRLLKLRYLEPTRYRELRAEGVLPLTQPDRYLLENRAAEAAQAYRDHIAASADPQPEAWIGLALALHRLPFRAVFAEHLPLMFDVDARLGGLADPLDLASWFA